MKDLVIVGCGGHGRELFDTVAAINRVAPTWNVLGFVDDDPRHPERVERLGSRVLGDMSWLVEHPCTYAVGVGTSASREQLVSLFDSAGLDAATLIHPGAHVGTDVRLRDGVVIYDRCTLTTNVTIGRHTHLNVACAVQHDSEVGDFVQLSPGVFVNGDCRVGDEVFLGTGAIVTRGVSVGAGARIGAGAVVLEDVAAGTTVVGIPARAVSRPRPRH